jgi:hypothetical protein
MATKKKERQEIVDAVEVEESARRQDVGALLSGCISLQIASRERETARRELLNRWCLVNPHGGKTDEHAEGLERALTQAFGKTDRRLQKVILAMDACTKYYRTRLAELAKTDEK